MRGQYRIVVDRPWGLEQRTNQGVGRELIESWKPAVHQCETIVRTVAYFDGYPQQSFIRGYAWMNGGGWTLVHTATAEDWQPEPGSRDMMNWPHWHASSMTREEWLATDRGRKADLAFNDVRRVAWQVVCPDFLAAQAEA